MNEVLHGPFNSRFIFDINQFVRYFCEKKGSGMNNKNSKCNYRYRQTDELIMLEYQIEKSNLEEIVLYQTDS